MSDSLPIRSDSQVRDDETIAQLRAENAKLRNEVEKVRRWLSKTAQPLPERDELIGNDHAGDPVFQERGNS
jgi:hypothetical protein